MKSITQLIQEVSNLKQRVITLESIVIKLTTKGTSKEEVPTNAELFKKMKVVMEECSITNSERLFLSNCLKQSFLSNKQVPIIQEILSKYGN
jgi:pyruvate dehydrogenase complex dehydrogenase (E1) component